MKAILHEPTEALKINRYIYLNPVRIAALGGHETRDVAAHEITAQLARRRVDAWNNTIGVPTLSSLEPEQHLLGYAPSPSWRSSVEARNPSSKRRFVNS